MRIIANFTAISKGCLLKKGRRLAVSGSCLRVSIEYLNVKIFLIMNNYTKINILLSNNHDIGFILFDFFNAMIFKFSNVTYHSCVQQKLNTLFSVGAC